MTVLTRRTFVTAALAAVGGAMVAASAKAAGHAANHEVFINGFAFEPRNLVINVGDTVTFTNKDGAPHTATSDNGSFETGRLKRGASATLSFDSAGNFGYFCKFHRKMKGTITVKS